MLEHRTEPVDFTLYIDEIMVDLGVWRTTTTPSGKSAGALSQLAPSRPTMSADAGPLAEVTPELEAQAVALDEIAARLEKQRLRDWIDYAHLLKANVEAGARRREGLRVPVNVNIDLDSSRPSDPTKPAWGLADELVEEPSKPHSYPAAASGHWSASERATRRDG